MILSPNSYRSWGEVMETMEVTKAMKVMEEANRIIEDFSFQQYGLYIVLFGIEIAITFWVALKFL